MRRREFIKLLSSTAAAWPLTAQAQQKTLPVIGFVRDTSLIDSTGYVAAFRQGLQETGYVEGQNLAIEYRYGENDRNRLPALVADLIRRPVDVIAANLPAALPAKAATTTVPIVFVTGGDPVQAGLVTSINRPGGNLTGIVFLAGALGTKRLELLRQLVPKAATIAMLTNLTGTETETEQKDVQAAAQAIGQQLLLLDVNSDRDIETAFKTLAQRGVGAVLVGAGSFLTSHRNKLVALAAGHAIPALYILREFVAAGGLMSYGTSITNAYREAGIYTGRILKGEKPGDLPVMQSVKFEFVINLKTAKALGLTVPPSLLALADEVIE
jgi:putative tryptophan/tyrosine transport system substrate-binding protein